MHPSEFVPSFLALLLLVLSVADANRGSWWSSFSSSWSASTSSSGHYAASTASSTTIPSEPSTVVPFAMRDPTKEVMSKASREKWGWLLDASKVPPGPFSGCWHMAVAALRERCSEMDHGTRQFLALRLANCQLVMGGRRSLVCPALEKAASGAALEGAMAACLKKLATDDVAYTTFNDMWIVTDQVCYEVTRAQWEQQAQATITELGVRAVETVGLLYETKAASATILQRQQEGLELQREAAVLQGEVREGLAVAREETGKLAAGLESGIGELLEQQRLMQEAQEQTRAVARQLLRDVERARAMHQETHEAVERGFEATRRHLDILSRFRRDVEDVLALLWKGLRPALLFVLVFRCLPRSLRPPARRLAALVLVSSFLWGVFLTGWDMTVENGPQHFRLGCFVREHAQLFAMLGLAIVALTLLDTHLPGQWRLAQRQQRSSEDATTAEQEHAGVKSNSTRPQLSLAQERALRAAAAEVVTRGTSRSTGRGGAAATAAKRDEMESGGGAAPAAAVAVGGTPSSSAASSPGVASPARRQQQQQQQRSGLSTPQGSTTGYDSAADDNWSQSGTPRRRSPRLLSGQHHRPRHPPLSPVLAPVAEEGEE